MTLHDELKEILVRYKYNQENTYIRPGGTWRECRICIKTRDSRKVSDDGIEGQK